MKSLRAPAALAPSRINNAVMRQWAKLGPEFMPFADVVSADLPLSRLLRLSLFQVSVGMAVVLMIGTLNRVMIVELGVPARLVAVMVALPLLFAPFRALVGFRSDTHRSVLGWRRVPYLWLGSMLQFGGFAIMPTALIVLSGDSDGPIWMGEIGAGLAFLLVGAGMHTVQTVGLALATDIAPPRAHTKVVVLMCLMLLVGMVISAVSYGLLLRHFSEVRLIQVVQAAALVTMVLNGVALWKQEPRDPTRTAMDRARPKFSEAWRSFSEGRRSTRRLVAVGLGTAAFSMEDILLEPYGGQVLGLSVSATTTLTALLAVGGMCGFGLSALALKRGMDPYRLAAMGVLTGLAAFSAVLFAAPLDSAILFGLGTTLIGIGGAMFAVGTLLATIALAPKGQSGLALGAWGGVQAFAAGAAIAAGGIIRDIVGGLASSGTFGATLSGPATGYGAVYQIEIIMLFATLVALGPLVRPNGQAQPWRSSGRLDLAGLST